MSYVVKATGTQSGYYAQVYFTDAASATLDQCANGSLTSPDLTPCQGGDPGGEGWVNGNLGASKSHYAEGESISYRLMFSGLSAGTHVVTIEWDTTKGGKHAIDYLTTYNRSVNSNPCEGVAGCNQGVFNVFAISRGSTSHRCGSYAYTASVLERPAVALRHKYKRSHATTGSRAIEISSFA